MKNWNTLEADLNLLMNKHFTKGRQGRSINKIILHHNDGNLSIQGCWNVWQTRPASAHYQVETSGRIGQLVWDRDTAWHAGNWVANTTSIGIEHADASTHPYRISDACLENGAHLGRRPVSLLQARPTHLGQKHIRTPQLFRNRMPRIHSRIPTRRLHG